MFVVQKSYSMPIGLDFQRRYATTVLDLEQLNKDLNKVLHEVQQFCYEVSEFELNSALRCKNIYTVNHDVTLTIVQLAPEQGMQPADQPSELRRRCEDEAQDTVRLSNNLPDGEQRVQNPALTQLISRLTALLLQIRVSLCTTSSISAHTQLLNLLPPIRALWEFVFCCSA